MSFVFPCVTSYIIQDINDRAIFKNNNKKVGTIPQCIALLPQDGDISDSVVLLKFCHTYWLSLPASNIIEVWGSLPAALVCCCLLYYQVLQQRLVFSAQPWRRACPWSRGWALTRTPAAGPSAGTRREPCWPRVEVTRPSGFGDEKVSCHESCKGYRFNVDGCVVTYNMLHFKFLPCVLKKI